MRVRGAYEGQSLKHLTHMSREHISHSMAPNDFKQSCKEKQRRKKKKYKGWVKNI